MHDITKCLFVYTIFVSKNVILGRVFGSSRVPNQVIIFVLVFMT
jgi:hypothetical protein